jgi:hypothetical protein
MFNTEEKLYCKLANEIELYTSGFTELVEEHAKKKGLKNIRCYIAVSPNGYREYLLIEGQTPIFVSQKIEDVAAHVDIMAMGV